MTAGPIAPLDPNVFRFAPVDGGFTNLTGNELGDTANMLASIDQTMNEFIGSIIDQSTLITSMEHDLDDVGSVLSEIDADTFDSVASDLAGIAGSLDTLSSLGDVPLPM